MAINFIKKGIDTSDATATANDIAENKTAYVDGQKINGNLHVVSSGSVINSNTVINRTFEVQIKSDREDQLIRKGGGVFCF